MRHCDEDVLLAERIQQGDPPSAREFVERFQIRLLNVARSGGFAEEAEDLVQETLLAAIQLIRHGRYRGEGSLFTLTFRILRNKMADEARKRAKQLPFESLDANPECTQGARELAAPGDPAAAHEIRSSVNWALQQIQPEKRMALILNEAYGFTAQDISGLLGRSPARVGGMIAEAKKMFRDLICSSSARSRQTLVRSGDHGE